MPTNDLEAQPEGETPAQHAAQQALADVEGWIFYSTYTKTLLKPTDVEAALKKVCADKADAEYIWNKIPPPVALNEAITRAMSSAGATMKGARMEWRDGGTNDLGHRVLFFVSVDTDANTKDVRATAKALALIEPSGKFHGEALSPLFQPTVDALENAFNAELGGITASKVWATVQKFCGWTDSFSVGHGMIFASGDAARRIMLLDKALGECRSPYRVRAIKWQKGLVDGAHDDAHNALLALVEDTTSKYALAVEAARATGDGLEPGKVTQAIKGLQDLRQNAAFISRVFGADAADAAAKAAEFSAKAQHLSNMIMGVFDDAAISIKERTRKSK